MVLLDQREGIRDVAAVVLHVLVRQVRRVPRSDATVGTTSAMATAASREFFGGCIVIIKIDIKLVENSVKQSIHRK